MLWNIIEAAKQVCYTLTRRSTTGHNLAMSAATSPAFDCISGHHLGLTNWQMTAQCRRLNFPSFGVTKPSPASVSRNLGNKQSSRSRQETTDQQVRTKNNSYSKALAEKGLVGVDAPISQKSHVIMSKKCKQKFRMYTWILNVCT